jgi:hypothetical protein
MSRSGASYNGTYALVTPVGGSIVIDPLCTPSASGGATDVWANALNSSVYFGVDKENSSPSSTATISFKFYAPAGTYNFALFTLKNTDAPIVQITIDGTSINSAGTDLYAAFVKYELDITGITLTEGVHTITFAANGKNASSSSYVIRLNRIIFSRTA